MSTCSSSPTRAARRRRPLYTFPTIAAYQAAQNGTNRLGYTSFTQYFGLPDLEYNTSQYGFFVQDDWRVGADLKILYGVRYDLYGVPEADPNAPVETSRDFPVSKSNFAPRLGAVWTLGSDRRSVVRANTGIMYDQTLNAIYEQALQNDGTNARASANFTPTQAGAPVVPGGAQRRRRRPAERGLDRGPGLQGRALVAEQRAVRAPAGRQLLGRRWAPPTCKGNNLPVVTNINLINPTGSTPSGIPIFSPTVSAATRVDPRYNAINSTQSIGDSTYKNMTLQLTRRSPSIRLRLRLHAGQERGQRADHRRAVGAGRCRPHRHDQPRPRARAEHPRPAPHLQRQHRLHAAASIVKARWGRC